MHVLIGYVTLLAVSSALADTTTSGPSPPPYVEPSKGPPKDDLNCRLNAQSALTWIVAVWDPAEKMVVGHGSMLTYITFITTCGSYSKAATAYNAHAQHVWDVKQPLNPCMQSKEVEAMFKHPKCTQGMPEFSVFDVSVFKLKNPFEITGTVYPAVSIPNSLQMMRAEVSFLNNMAKTRGCFLVSFADQEAQKPIFNFNVDMQIVPFHDKCVKLLCEMNPANPTKTGECQKQFQDKENNTMLCVKNTTEADIQLGKGDSYWLTGAPLVCNGSTVGIAAKPKMRHAYSTEKTNFHYVLTFSRVYPWLVENLQKFAPPWLKPVYIGNKDFKRAGDPVDPPEPLPTLRPTTIWPTPPDVIPGSAPHALPTFGTPICLSLIIYLSA